MPKINPNIKRAKYGKAAKMPECSNLKPSTSDTNFGPPVNNKYKPQTLPKCDIANAQNGTERKIDLYGGKL